MAKVRNTALYEVRYREIMGKGTKVARVRARSASEARAFYPKVVSVKRIGR